MGLAWMIGNHGKPNHNIQPCGAHMYGWHNWGIAWPNYDTAVVFATNNWAVPEIVPDVQMLLAFIENWLMRDIPDVTARGSGADWAKRSPMCAVCCSQPRSIMPLPSQHQSPTSRFLPPRTGPCSIQIFQSHKRIGIVKPSFKVQRPCARTAVRLKPCPLFWMRSRSFRAKTSSRLTPKLEETPN